MMSLSQQESSDGIMDLSTLSLTDMGNFDSPLLSSQSFHRLEANLPTAPHPHLISTPYVTRQQLKPQFTSSVSPISQPNIAGLEDDNINNNVKKPTATNNNLTFNSPPCIPPSTPAHNAENNGNDLQATFDHPKMLEATFDQPQLQATFDQPQMLEATFDEPQLQATFNHPKILEATFDQPPVLAAVSTTFDRPEHLQATFDKSKMLEATFDKPSVLATGSTTFDRPEQLQATFDVNEAAPPSKLMETFNQPSPAQMMFEEELLEMKFDDVDDDLLMPPPPASAVAPLPTAAAAGDEPNSTFPMEDSPLFDNGGDCQYQINTKDPLGSTFVMEKNYNLQSPTTTIAADAATDKSKSSAGLNTTRTMQPTSKTSIKPTTTASRPTLKKFVPPSQRTASATSSKQQTTAKKIGGGLLRPTSGILAKRSGLRAPASGGSGVGSRLQEPKSGVSSAVVQKSPSLIGKAAVSPAKATKLQSISKSTTAPTGGNAAATVSSPAAEKLKRKTATGGGAAASRSMRAPSSGGSRLLNGRTTATSSAASGLRAPVTSLKPKSKVTSQSNLSTASSNRSSNISNKPTTTTTTSSRKPLSTVNKPSSRQSIYATATKATARNNVNNKPTTASRYATTNKLKRQQPVTFATLGIQTDEDVDALTGTEANSLRKELDELKQTLHAKEVEHETERETLMKDVSELRTELENLKQSHEEEIERLQEMHREEVEKTENLQVEVEDAQGKVMEFEVKLHKMVEPRLKELLKPYQNAYEECQSLKSVLDIKNEETRKLQKEHQPC